jgi:hypothetical protein
MYILKKSFNLFLVNKIAVQGRQKMVMESSLSYHQESFWIVGSSLSLVSMICMMELYRAAKRRAFFRIMKFIMILIKE